MKKYDFNCDVKDYLCYSDLNYKGHKVCGHHWSALKQKQEFEFEDYHHQNILGRTK